LGRRLLIECRTCLSKDKPRREMRTWITCWLTPLRVGWATPLPHIKTAKIFETQHLGLDLFRKILISGGLKWKISGINKLLRQSPCIRVEVQGQARGRAPVFPFLIISVVSRNVRWKRGLRGVVTRVFASHHFRPGQT
jgi:hypothetical protein